MDLKPFEAILGLVRKNITDPNVSYAHKDDMLEVLEQYVRDIAARYDTVLETNKDFVQGLDDMAKLREGYTDLPDSILDPMVDKVLKYDEMAKLLAECYQSLCHHCVDAGEGDAPCWTEECELQKKVIKVLGFDPTEEAKAGCP